MSLENLIIFKLQIILIHFVSMNNIHFIILLKSLFIFTSIIALIFFIYNEINIIKRKNDIFFNIYEININENYNAMEFMMYNIHNFIILISIILFEFWIIFLIYLIILAFSFLLLPIEMLLRFLGIYSLIIPLLLILKYYLFKVSLRYKK